MPSSGATCPATFVGFLIRNGFAKTVTASSDTARSRPWRSTIAPRAGGVLAVRAQVAHVTRLGKNEAARQRDRLDALRGAEFRQLQRERRVLALETRGRGVGAGDAVVQLEHVDVEEDDAREQDAHE